MAETVFKRLGQQDARGRFAFYKWPALTPLSSSDITIASIAASNPAEDWLALMNSFPGDFKKNLYSFSQGPVVCGAALTVYNDAADNYVLSQGVIPAGCYDTSASINSYSDFLDEETQPQILLMTWVIAVT